MYSVSVQCALSFMKRSNAKTVFSICYFVSGPPPKKKLSEVNKS